MAKRDKRVDAYGDVLPDGALTRIGSDRFVASYVALVFSPDGQWLATGCHELVLWKRSGERGKTVKIKKTRSGNRLVRSVAFTPDSSRVAFLFQRFCRHRPSSST